MAGDRMWVKGEGFKIETNFSQEIQMALNNIRNYDNRTQAAIESAIRKTGENIKKRAQQKVPVRTGKLKASIKASFDEKRLIGQVYTKRPSAHLVEYGAAATEVIAHATATAKARRQALLVPGIGFVKSVKIPKREAKPFMGPALEEERPAMIEAIRRAVSKL